MTTTTSTISAEVPDCLRVKLEEAAQYKGMSIGSFVIDAAVREAEQVIERERLIRLSQEDAALVQSLLDHPPRPESSLQRAATQYEQLSHR